MRASIRWGLFAALLFRAAIGHAQTAAPAAGLSLEAAVQREGPTRYHYAYTLKNPGKAPCELLSFCVDAPGATPIAFRKPDPVKVQWEDPLTDGLASWDVTDAPLAGGAAVTLGLEATGPPTLRRAVLNPPAREQVEAYVKAQAAKHCLPEEPSLLEERRKIAVQRWTLAPLDLPPGTFAHFNRFEEDLTKAGELGWITSPELAASIKGELRKIRRDMVGEDWPGALRDWGVLASEVDAAPDGACRPEVRVLVHLTADSFASARPSPCEPDLRVTAPDRSSPVDGSQVIGVRLSNRSGPAPIAEARVAFAVEEGPHKGLLVERTTDAEGEASLLLAGVAEGEDRVAITARHGPGDACPRGPVTGSAAARWSGGPNLKIFWSSESRLSVRPGQVMTVRESVRNFGNGPSKAAEVRYYMSDSPEWGEGTRILWGARAVPPLQPGEESVVNDAPLPLPLGITPGLYFFHAVVNEDRKVMEVCYWDDHSVNFFSADSPVRSGIGIAMGVEPSSEKPPGAAPAPSVGQAPTKAGAVASVDPRDILPPKHSGAWFSIGPPDLNEPNRFHATPASSGCQPDGTRDQWGKTRRGPLLIPLDDIPEAVLKDAVGEAAIGSVSDELRLPRFEEAPEGFRQVGRLSAAEVHPLTENRYDGVVRHVPVTRRKGAYLEIVYDVRQNLRAWIRMAADDDTADGETASTDFTPFTGETAFTTDWRRALFPDLECLGREPFVRIYKSPDRRSPWRLLDPGYELPVSRESGVRLILGQRNGFGVLALDSCDGEERVVVGWVPLRDEQGRLIVWVSDDAGCC